MRPKPCKPREVQAVVFSLGFVLDRSSGSHRTYKNSSGESVSISFHPGDVPLGTLREIIKQMGISVEEFNRMV